jgi:signal transduction histidine kinase
MIQSINSLFERINRTLSLERGFTAVAAHELRTPLAGLRAQAQVAALARTPEELAEALASVMSSVDRASHLLDQLLDLARVRSGRARRRPCGNPSTWRRSTRRGPRPGPAGRAAQSAPEADFMERRVVAMELGVLLLLRNLVGNAIRYTPARRADPVHTGAKATGAPPWTIPALASGLNGASRCSSASIAWGLRATKVSGWACPSCSRS